MNARERYYATTHFKSVDRTFFLPTWCWDDTIARWHKEGLPQDMSPAEYFGTDRYEIAPLNLGPLGTVSGVIPLDPPFERVILEETTEHRVVRVADGQVVRENRINPMANMPSWLDYPLKTRKDWEKEFVPRLDPASQNRYPPDWDEYVLSVQDRDYPLGIWTGSFWGRPQTWMGLERWSMAFFDDPAWVHEILDHLLWLVIETFRPALNAIDFDFAFIWEDLGMKTGPMVSPRLFREFMLPRYKTLVGFLKDHGIDVIMVDSDGQNGPIIPLWLEAGVTGLRPLEAAADEDAVALRRQYGQHLVLEGNIDKRILATSPEEIESHVLSKVPWLLTQGGYIPQVDHLTPPDVSFDNYCFFWELIQKVASDPERYLHEAKRQGLWID
jgi:uroporphyrinogen decarboxylase